MNGLWLVAVLLVLFGTVLAAAEASLTRTSRVRALALQEDGRRNAETLVKIESDPPRYLNAVYLAVMFVQNGSAILVAILAEREFGSTWVTLASFLFTLLYFVVVEAMAKTFAVLHTDRVALALSPVVWFLGRVLELPTRFLIGLANVLLPGRGLKQGPFVSEEEIRSMAEVGHEEGSIDEGEKELIHSIFEFGDTIVREVMVPRPDIVAIEDDKTLRDVQDLVLRRGFSRIPVYHESLDEVKGVVFAKDVLKALHQGKRDMPLSEIVRDAHYVPESKKVADLLKEMQQEKFHQALVYDEHGSVTGIVALEDLLEELVGEIVDEYDREEPEVLELADGTYRVSGKASIDDVNELLGMELPDEEWDTVAGLMLELLGRMPEKGEETTFRGLSLKADRVQGRRIASVVITRTPELDGEEGGGANGG
ncbi:MAG TPA: hemolysin family protein [Actinomycetota bacterium]